MYRVAVALMLGATILLSSCRHSDAAPPTTPTALFVEVDAVTLDLSGVGLQTGTITGTISGTTVVTLQWTPAGPVVGGVLPVTFQNKVTITDIDGDQIFFDNNGTGSLHFGVPSDAFKGTGGPMAGTYVVTGGTGKYQSWTVGTMYQYHAIMTNPPTPPGGPGSVYAEIHS